MKGDILFNPEKAGTIILSHYRSGGTQMRNFIGGICRSTHTPYVDCREFDLDFSKDLEPQVESYFVKTENYKVIQLNNPISIGYLISSGRIDSIFEQYNVFRVYREDKKRTLLSLPVWERLIQEKLFGPVGGYIPEVMDDFGCRLENEPLKYHNIHLGLELNIDTKNPAKYLNSMLWIFTQSHMVLELLQLKYNLPSVCYEVYEEQNETFYNEYLKQYEDSTIPEDISQPLKALYIDTYVNKIPYMVKDFEVYFEEEVQKVVKDWKL